MRMQIRRLTRLTNGFSKKWSNSRAMLAIYFGWYNFCRVHRTLRVTLAMDAGIADHVWEICRTPEREGESMRLSWRLRFPGHHQPINAL